MSSKLDTRVIQVTNIAPSTTKEQLKMLFQFLGRIKEIKVFPPDGVDQQVAAKVCYIEFEDATSAGVSLHLINTVFIDRALIVVPVMDGKIPDETVAMQLTPQTVAHMNHSQPVWPASVVSQLSGSGTDQVITTYDPRLNALGQPQYPPLPAGLDTTKVEEIRRTVYIGNLDPQTTPENLITFFSQAGEVKYVRMAGDDGSGARAAYLELTDQRTVAITLGYNGFILKGRKITVNHATMSIDKPLIKTREASRREVEEAMKKVEEAQPFISAAAGEKRRSRSQSRRKSRSRGYSRSRSRSRKRSGSRSKGRRRHSRTRSPRRKSRSPRRNRRSRSRSLRRRRSRSRSGIVVIPARERRRPRSTSRPMRRTRSRSRRRSRTPPRAYASRRSRSRSRGAGWKSRSQGMGKEKKEKGTGEKKKEKTESAPRSPSPATLQREESPAPGSDVEASPVKLDSSSKGKEEVGETESAPSSEAAGDKKSSKQRDRSLSPLRRQRSPSRSPMRRRKRSVSRSPGRGSRRRSASPRKRLSKSRSSRHSRSPAKKKKAKSPRRSRSGSRHRSKKEKKEKRSKSRERKEKKKKKSKEKREEKSSSSGKVSRNYEEEEKGFNNASEHEEDIKSQGGDDDDHRSSADQAVDRDTSE